MQIILIFQDLPDFERANLAGVPDAPRDLALEVRHADMTVKIRVPPGFFHLYAQPTNIAEREFVRMIFRITAALARAPVGELDLDRLAAQVMPDENAREYHLTYAQEFRHYIADFWTLTPRLIDAADLHRETFGLAWELRTPAEPREVHDRRKCGDFLNGVVDRMWFRIRERLAQLDRASVILRCLENVEALDRDAEQWRLSARALLAIQGEEAVDVAVLRQTERARANHASRVLVEMALCASPLRRGALITEADFDALQACVTFLNYAANQSDALQYELAHPPILICPNGEFIVDEDYHEKTVTPYLHGQFAENYQAAAADYANLYQPPQHLNKPPERFEPVYERAFVAEFGIELERWIEFLRWMQDDALSRKELIVLTRKFEFMARLAAAGFAAEEGECILKEFGSWPRPRWDEAPSGFRNKDWWPWRFNRRLSLIARPIVVCDTAEDAEIFYAPGFVSDCARIHIERTRSAQFPKEYYRSHEMRAWADAVTLRRSAEFEGAVADEFRKLGCEARVAVAMTELGADARLGDLDVLAWHLDRKKVFLVECKRLRFARTISEIGERLRGFRGNEQDDLARHVRRAEWLDRNRSGLARITHLPASELKTVPMLVTNTLVPMQFVSALPLPPDRIVPIDHLDKLMPTLLRQG